MWNVIDFSLSQEESYDPTSDAQKGHYEGYREQELPNGYTPYGQNSHANAVDEYDRYESDYEESTGDDGPKNGFCQKLKSCCNDLGRLVHSFNKRHEKRGLWQQLKSIIVWPQKVIDAKMYSSSDKILIELGTLRAKSFKGPSMTTSDEYSKYTTRLFCGDPESSFALSFQEWNLLQQITLPILFTMSSLISDFHLLLLLKYLGSLGDKT